MGRVAAVAAECAIAALFGSLTLPSLQQALHLPLPAACLGHPPQPQLSFFPCPLARQALQMPHYSASSMPALSLHCSAHFAQWARDLSFRLFDHGSAAANQRAYGSDRPPSLAEHYHLLADLPVDLVAGDADGVIAAADVRTHYERMQVRGRRAPCLAGGAARLADGPALQLRRVRRASHTLAHGHMQDAGVRATFRVMSYGEAESKGGTAPCAASEQQEKESCEVMKDGQTTCCLYCLVPLHAGHMDFTFAVRDDIREFVLSRLMRPL